MICKINTTSDHFRVFRYCLQPTKRATILETNIKGDALDRAIRGNEAITAQNAKELLAELSRPFAQLKRVRPRVEKSVVHIKFGFDPRDGYVSNQTKVDAAYRLMDALGYSNTPRGVVDHHRNDPSHPGTHDHDHTHGFASTINYSFEHVRDSYNFQKAKEALRAIERDFGLTPFLSNIERRDQDLETDLGLAAQANPSPIVYSNFEVIAQHEHQPEAREGMGR